MLAYKTSGENVLQSECTYLLTYLRASVRSPSYAERMSEN